MKVVAYVPDLMDRSKFDAVKDQVDIKFASRPEQLASVEADLLIVDLGRPGVIEALSGSQAEKVGFISHVDDDARLRATTAGVRVYARSAFFSRLVSIVTKSG